MHNSVIAQGLARQLECPEIHKKVEKLTGRKTGFDESVSTMILDLKANVPELSTRQLSTLVGVSRNTVMRALDNSVERDEWTTDDNEDSAAAELAALRKHHPSGYIDHPDHINESVGVVYFSAPPFADRHRVADQAHTLPRPITLATRPYGVAA